MNQIESEGDSVDCMPLLILHQDPNRTGTLWIIIFSKVSKSLDHLKVMFVSSLYDSLASRDLHASSRTRVDYIAMAPRYRTFSPSTYILSIPPNHSYILETLAYHYSSISHTRIGPIIYSYHMNGSQLE